MSFWCLQFSQKTEQKQFDLRYHSSKVEFFSFVFWENWRYQRHFEINWPLWQAAWRALTTLYGEPYYSYHWVPQVMFLYLYWNSEGFSWLGQVGFWPVSLVDEFELICTVCKAGKICRADEISRLWYQCFVVGFTTVKYFISKCYKILHKSVYKNCSEV